MNSLRSAKRFVFPLLGLWVLLYASFSLFTPPLLDGRDASQAEAAREMAVHGDWITPHVNGVRTLGASPLLTWSVAAWFKLFGVSDWGARLVMALFGMGLLIAVMALGTRLFVTPTAGFYAALILLTSEGTFLFAHLLYPEILASLWLSLAMYFFWRSLRHEHASIGTAIGFGAMCALGALSQGVMGALVPVLVVALFLAFTRNLRHLLRWHPVVLILVFLVIALPWQVAVHMANRIEPQFLRILPDHHAPLLLVWAFLLLWIMPWCFFAGAALVRMPEKIPARFSDADCARRDCVRQSRLLLLLWVLAVALAVMFRQYEEASILPALPALALLAGGWLTADEAAPGRVGRVFAWIFLVAGVLKGLAALVIAVRAPFPKPGTDIASLLDLHAGHHHLFFGHITDLTLASMGAFRIPLYIFATALLVGVSANFYFRLRNQARMANCFLAGMMAFVLIAAHIALNTFSPVISSAVLAQAINPEMQPTDVVIINGRFGEASAMGFYLERPVHLLKGDSGPFASDAPELMETPASVAALWSGPGRVFLWTRPESVPELPGPVYQIARDGGREILSNRPNGGGASF
jgi:4-amino-4-deoxy-L-arabinose transferase-like glycosyltransferase